MTQQIENRHTPGPWGMIHIDGGIVVDANYGKTDIAKVALRSDQTVTEANAKLIAAAPELLEALRKVVAISDRKHDAWDEAKAVIAKATGQQP